MEKYLYQEIASLVQARLNCKESGNQEWFEKHTERVEELVKEHFPHGSGFDSGCHIDWERSRTNKLVFTTEYHHMDEWGGYHHWSGHNVIVTPSLSSGYELYISGQDWHGWKEYAYQVFHDVMTQMVKIGV